MIALTTGMRRGEIAAATADNMRPGVLRLPHTKNGTVRDVPISAKAAKHFPEIFEGRYFPVSPHSITCAFRQACAVADIEDLNFHDLRHEATSRLFESGFEATEVAQIVGHKGLNMTYRYTHHKAENLAKRLNKLPDKVA